MKNVLVYPCGTDEGLELNKSLGQMIHYRLYGVSDTNGDRGEHVYLNHEGVLNLDEAHFVDELTEIVERLQIDFIYPANSEARLILSKYGLIQQAEVVACSHEACLVCDSAENISDFFNKDLLVQDSSSLQKLEESQFEIYSVVCFTDRQGDIKFTKILENTEYVLREPNISILALDHVRGIAKKINNKIQLRGPWSFEIAMMKSQDTALIGITPGFSAQMGFYRNKGVNLATLSLFDRLGHDIEIRERELQIKAVKVQTSLYHIHYEYDDVYVDLDDTILVNNLVNPLIIAFIYQCRNKGKNVHLITKHRHELSETLEKFKITTLFDTIIWLKSFDQKCLHMKSERAIFIDDAFSERKQVSERLGIPTFEVSAVESLMDWRL
ncbi:hypothetical protein [Cohnella sp.]|uniref:hypothetical protein n=1 Tax=Cohnella sp. TaxID=1883426 RepID=UPI003562CC1F